MTYMDQEWVDETMQKIRKRNKEVEMEREAKRQAWWKLHPDLAPRTIPIQHLEELDAAFNRVRAGTSGCVRVLQADLLKSKIMSQFPSMPYGTQVTMTAVGDGSTMLSWRVFDCE